MTGYDCNTIKTDISARYDVLLQVAPFGFLLVDLAGNILEVNEPALRILGSPSMEATKAINMLSFPPLEDVGVSQLIRDSIGSKQPLAKIFTYTSKWDKTITMKCTSCAIRDNDSVCFVAFIIEDITTLEQMRDKYYRIAQTLASVVDHIESHYIWAKNKDGKYHMVSKSYSDLFDKTPRDMIGLSDYDLYPKAMADAFFADDEDVLHTCGTKEICEIITTPMKGTRHWRTIKNAICDGLGEGIITVGIAEDITEEYERRESAKRAIKELETFVKRHEKG